jgi:hypothetical protein
VQLKTYHVPLTKTAISYLSLRMSGLGLRAAVPAPSEQDWFKLWHQVGALIQTSVLPDSIIARFRFSTTLQ